LVRPVVAFCNIESEINAKAGKRVTDLTVDDSGEGEDGEQNKGTNPIDKDGGFDLEYDDVDLESAILAGILSDSRPAPSTGNLAASIAAAADIETGDREPTEDEWENT
jgi:hypothetical protein